MSPTAVAISLFCEAPPAIADRIELYWEAFCTSCLRRFDGSSYRMELGSRNVAHTLSCKLMLPSNCSRYKGIPPTIPYACAASCAPIPPRKGRLSKKSKGLSSICAVRLPYSGLLSSRTCSFMNDIDEPQSTRNSFEDSLLRSTSACRYEGTPASALAR